MSSTLPNCPQCDSEYTYEDGAMCVCPTCSHEWAQALSSEAAASKGPKVYKDAHGNILEDGDTISVIKDLRIGGSSDCVKQGTKVKGSFDSPRLQKSVNWMSSLANKKTSCIFQSAATEQITKLKKA